MWPTFVDARWQIEADANMALRYPTRVSESDQPSSERLRFQRCAGTPGSISSAAKSGKGICLPGELTTNIRILDFDISWRDVVLIGDGAFLTMEGTMETH